MFLCHFFAVVGFLPRRLNFMKGVRMRKLVFLLLAAVALTCCGLKELGEIVPEPGIPDYIDPPLPKTELVVTGLEYPEGYDWNHPETANGTPDIVMYRGDRLVLRIPTGEEHAVSEDLDMHRYVGGHVYTDYSTDTHTIVSRDGAELFRYAGRERIVLLAERDGRVLTLGEARDGRGFSSRVDGVPVFIGFDGSVFQNAGVSPEGEIRFFYRLPVNSTSGITYLYYAVTGPDCVMIELPADIVEVYGFVFREDPSSAEESSDAGGGIKVLCRRSNPDFPDATQMEIFDVDAGTGRTVSTSGFLSSIKNGTVLSDAAPLLSVLSVSAMFSSRTAVYSGTRCWQEWSRSDIPTGFRHLGDSVAGVRKSLYSGGVDILCNGSVCDTLPRGYTTMTDAALCCTDRGIKVGMTSTSGGRAIVWRSGKVDSLAFRGIVTSVMEELEAPADE